MTIARKPTLFGEPHRPQLGQSCRNFLANSTTAFDMSARNSFRWMPVLTE
ncbi:hypothetical protein SXCC_04243 [Gluconacetobacter sp. SXCC-1]|nr:hypothetical protein SXCC_04243 [Gluconacetobacter sp. SXCC-1]